jgi:hypothetical protein
MPLEHVRITSRRSSHRTTAWCAGRWATRSSSRREIATELRHDFLGGSRRFGWSFLGAFAGRAIREHSVSTDVTNAVEDLGFDIELGFYRLLSATGGFMLHDPDKMIDYSRTPKSARYAFTFWDYADRWKQLSDWVRTADPDGRMVSPFFAELLA